MAAEHVNREEIERRIERLRGAYDDPPVVETSFEVDPGITSTARDGYIGGGYCWIVRSPEQGAPLSPSMPAEAGNEHARVLLILTRGSSEWAIPGGGLDGYDPDAVQDGLPEPRDPAYGETYEAAARREVREETDVECHVTNCFKMEHATWVPSDDPDVVLHLLYVFFEAEYVGGHIAVQPGELDGAAWWRYMPDRVHPSIEEKAARWQP